MENYLRPKEAMQQYIQPSLATELVNQLEAQKQSRRAKERKVRNERASTIIKDDDLWKELQQELSKSKCVSRASVQETTRKFMEKRRKELDEQAKAQQQQAQKPDPRNRRRSSTSDSPNRRSSMSILAEKGNNIRRNLSMGNSADTAMTQHEPRSKRDSVLGGFVNNQFSKMNDSLSKLNLDSSKLPLREKFFPSSSRSRANDDIFDVLNQASTISDKLDSMNESSTQLSSLSLSLGQLGTHEESIDERSLDGSGDSSDGDLLVLFPTQPRQRTQNNTSATARSA